jgi:starch-binding outer membrane protein, SusD/RagB family
MMKNRVKILFTLAMITLFSGCQKDFLEVDPIGKMSVELFYKTDEDATKAIMATYDILQWMNARDWNSAYLVKTFPSDESNVGGGDAGDQPPYQELGGFTYGPSNAPITAVWQSNYYGIYRANLVINNVLPETDLRKQIIAEAKFLRAYYYFEIASMFGKGPLILTELAPSEYSQPFVEADAIYEQVFTDLTEAIAGLPLKSQYASNDVFRASKGAAQALLGKAYLYAKKYTESAAAFETVILSTEYDLQADYSSLFLKESEFGIESLFEVSWVTTRGYDWGTFQWGGNRAMENNITWQLTGPRGDYFQPGTTGLIGGWGFNYPKQRLYDAFVAAGDDVRKSASVLSLADLRALGGDWTNETSWGWDGCIRVKYGTRMDETNGDAGAVAELNYGTNLRLIRFADVLLMAAEANHMAGEDGKATIYLNRVRQRAGLPPFSGDIMTAIKKERELELCFEGVRFLDLVRWGDAPAALGSLGFTAGKHEVFPIPQDEMRNNSKATQNNNY